MTGSFRPSVRSSVNLSVRLSHLFHHVPIIVSSWNFRELLPLTEVMSMQKVEVRSQRSRSQTSTPNLAVYGLLTQVWIHIWQWNHAHSWKQHRRGTLLPYCFSRSSVKFQGHMGQKVADFDPNLGFPESNSSLKQPIAIKWCTRLEVAQERCPIIFQGHQSNFNKKSWVIGGSD